MRYSCKWLSRTRRKRNVTRNRSELTDLGMKVLTTTHVLSGAERGISKSFGGVYPVEIVAHSLRMLGQGTKVCVEVSIMALDAGLIPYGEPIIAIGGSVLGGTHLEQPFLSFRVGSRTLRETTSFDE